MSKGVLIPILDELSLVQEGDMLTSVCQYVGSCCQDMALSIPYGYVQDGLFVKKLEGSIYLPVMWHVATYEHGAKLNLDLLHLISQLKREQV